MKACRFLARVVAGALLVFLAVPALAQSPTQTRLISSANPSRVGQWVRLTAEVDGLGGGAPAGIVTFSDGGATFGSGGLLARGAGQATVAAGYAHTCALASGGGAKCWGANFYGELGTGTAMNHHTPADVFGLSSGVVAITAGGSHTCALTSGGGAKCWGYNFLGALGDGTTTDRHTPVDVFGLSSGVVAITAGKLHTCALTSRGGVKCWGANESGQLGGGTTTNPRLTPVDVFGLSSGAVAITAGGSHTCVLTSRGGVKCWGANSSGQLGDGTTTPRNTPAAVFGLSSGAVAITAGVDIDGHTCALTSRGGVKCWGANYGGQLGDGTITNRLTPVDVLRLSGGIVAITAGTEHTCALGRPGGLRCWGRNEFGQLGDGTTTSHRGPSTRVGLLGLVRSRARLVATALGVGAHSLKASYPGDALHGASVGATTQTVK